MASLLDLLKRFTATQCGSDSGRGSAHYTKIGDAGFRRHVGSVQSASPSWTLDQPGTVASTASTSPCVTRVKLMGSGPR